MNRNAPLFMRSLATMSPSLVMDTTVRKQSNRSVKTSPSKVANPSPAKSVSRSLYRSVEQHHPLNVSQSHSQNQTNNANRRQEASANLYQSSNVLLLPEQHAEMSSRRFASPTLTLTAPSHQEILQNRSA